MNNQNILDFNERCENAWREIYESRQTRMLLTSEVIAIENHGSVNCAVVNYYGIKIIIPGNMLTVNETDTGRIYAMIGAEIDFVVIAIDKENNLATGSRKLAMELNQRELPSVKVGDRLKGNIIAVGVSKAIVNVCGLDIPVRNNEISWGYIFDVRTHLAVGDELDVIVKNIEPEAKTMSVSIKDALPDPYVNITEKYIINNKYRAIVTGIPDYGIFCNLEPGIDALCPHPGWNNMKLGIGDAVVVKVKEINRDQRKTWGFIDRLIKRGIR